MQTEFYIKQFGKSFYWAGKFLPKDIFKDCSTLYAICRLIDNLVDENQSRVKKDIQIFFRDYLKKKSYHPVIREFKKLQIKHSIHNKLIMDLFYGAKLDTKIVKIKNNNQLIKYSYYVAGVVGLMMATIFKTKNKEALKHAIDLGIAMQITNICRDVLEDASMGRIYIPQTYLGKNITFENVANKNIDEKKIYKAIVKTLDIAEKYYESGNMGIKYLPKKVQFSIYLASYLYRGIGIKIKKISYENYFKQRVYLTTFEKVKTTLKCIIFFYIFKKIKYKKHLKKLHQPLVKIIYARI
jgi:15-cis-phytoene synthase